MKKTKLGVLFIVTLLMISGIVIAQGITARYLVKSDNAALKAMFGVQHNFKTGFTTDLSPGQLKVLEKFGVEVEQVEIYTILAKPFCNYDGACQPELGENPSCADCKNVVEDPEEPTECFPDKQYPWGIERVNGGTGGAGIIVAVLDTGVDQNHPDLMGNIIDCVAFGYRTCEDGNGHGTHVAGTILANGKIMGVAPEAKLMAIKILKDNGRGYADDIAAGMRYAADNGGDFISMSLGGRESSLISDAVDYVVGEGVLVIAAAGNSGPTLGSIIYPAANPNVVAVGAIDSAENVPYWSSRGINDGDYVIEEREVEFGAPGVYVESTWKGGCYNIIQGTSMATPHVAGLAAKLWQTDAATTRTNLQELAKLYDLHTEGDDTATGFGLPIAP